MYGVIDIGSNTIRLVIYTVDRSADGRPVRLRRVMNKKYTASLAGYVDQDQEMTQRGIEKAGEVLSELHTLVDHIRLDRLYVFATASFRNIINTDEVVREVEARSGFSIQVLSGEEEAAYGYRGMLQEYRYLQQRQPQRSDEDSGGSGEQSGRGAWVDDSGIMIDLGGGSTEIVFFRRHRILASSSMPLGSLNLYRRHVDGILPTSDETRAIAKDVRRHLKKIEVPDDISRRVLFCVGGTARSMKEKIDSQFGVIGEDGCYDTGYLKRYEKFYRREQRACVRQILESSPERIHTLLPGLVEMRCIAEQYRCGRICTAAGGVREGYLMSQLEENDGKGQE
jgi:exopolyphosphatase/guanosine-5'-triphosphate,3'-diphosphate pyrophosphatase